MEIVVTNNSITKISCDTLIIHIFKDVVEQNEYTKLIDNALSGHISNIISENSDCSKYGETTIIHTFGMLNAKHVVLLGMGEKESLSIDKIRALSGIVARVIKKLHSISIAMIPCGLVTEKNDIQKIAQALLEGVILGMYQFNYYKTNKPEKADIRTLFLIENDANNTSFLKKGIHNAAIISEKVNLARDLVNHPAQYMTPAKMAICAQEIAQLSNVEFSVLEKEDMEKENMHALLAVARGSVQPPKMIVIKYMGDRTSKQITAFVGKGVTFDSGGISIKPSLNMGEMKSDMAGGAAVLGAMAAIGKLKPRINIIGIIPCTENMPDGNAFKPGDVIYSMSGKTIEIITTDAEGRLILADAITYANKLGATRIIDIATLTGACVVALGNVASGLITNNSALCQQVLHAASDTGEKMWELPNFPEYKEQLKGTIADLKNSGGRMAGAITAGSFIEEFVENTPWVHIDIAGTAYIEKEEGYKVKGATGVATRTLIQLALNISQYDS
jgi:leucyl aminopeptidase